MDFNVTFSFDNQTGDYGNLTNLNNLKNAVKDTFAAIDASNNVSLSIAYMDQTVAEVSTRLRVANIGIGEVSIGRSALEVKSNGIDASVGLTRIAIGEVSTRLIQYATNSSINAWGGVAEVSTRLNSYATNASVNTAWISVNETSTRLSVTNIGVGETSTRLNVTRIGVGEVSTKDIRLYNGTGAAVNLMGLKDASGVTGDLFQRDLSIYLKINSGWYHFICTSTLFG